jgi:hypothetical protein
MSSRNKQHDADAVSEKEPLDERSHNEAEDTRRDTDEWRTLRQCAEVVSLCRVRDAMGTGMQPMMGYLKYVFGYSSQNEC